MTARARTAGGIVAWLLTRGLVVWLLQGRHEWVQRDLDYFSASLAAVPEVGLAQTLVEYPLPGVLVVALPWLLVLAAGTQEYAAAVLLLSLAADAAFTLLLARTGPGRRAAVLVWLLAVPLLGATVYARFDLVPGLLAGTALLVLARRPRVAAAAAAVATGLKLWPVLVLPALAAGAGRRRAVVGVMAVTGGLLVAASLAIGGWARLVSPLSWQTDRGLQIEAVAATPAMVAWALQPASYEIAYSEYNAFEISGPASGLLLAATDALWWSAVVVLLVLWATAFRRGRTPCEEGVAWLALTAVSVLVVTSKVLSPQYLLWLLPLAAAATAVGRDRGLRAWSALLLLATGLTQLVFPELYTHLVNEGDRMGVAVVVLAARNALLLLLAGWALVAAWRGLSAATRSSASSTGRPGVPSAPSGGGPTTPR